MEIILILFLVLLVSGYVFMKHPRFGKLPSGPRLARIQKSPNYRNGLFQNLNNTPSLTEGASFAVVLYRFLFNRNKRKVPPFVLPTEKTNLQTLAIEKNTMVWFGHSSYFLKINGRSFLVDPVFSANASPLNFTTKSFRGTDIYSTDDLPYIDYLVITHDHWDHLDYNTVLKLKSKTGKIITGLGTGSHFERWGFSDEQVIEKDWNESAELEPGFKVTATPARHFSGRSFQRNKTLWTSFVLKTPDFKIFIGGDSGYDDHFTKIGNEHGPFDLAILENGQYNESWKYIHMMPEEVVQAAMDLRADKLLPVHWSRFSLSLHDWDESIIRIIKEAEKQKITLIHPMIGEEVDLNSVTTFRRWWLTG